jgi:hypothetical protein
MGFLPDRPLGRLSYRPEAIEKAHCIFERIQSQQEELGRTLPSTYQYLSKFHELARSADRSPVLQAITR